MRNLRYAALAIALLCPVFSQAAVLTRWVQLAPGGGPELRVLTDRAQCPSLVGPNWQVPLVRRAAPDANFPVLLCAGKIPDRPDPLAIQEARSGDDRVTNEILWGVPRPMAIPKRIMVFGDTGCRIKGTAVQACNDPKAWPFARIAQEAADLRPDLVIHVGDYLYRESPCPAGNAGCAGSPHGDNWATWNADFFAPAGPLLSAAPWVFVRGNHEDCQRAGPGWLRLLGADAYDPVAACAPHVAPYAVPIGGVNLIVMDNASAPDTSVDTDLLAGYKSDFAALAGLSGKSPTWLVMHRPIWGAIAGPANIPLGGNATLIAALGNGHHALDGTALMLAGHIHTFEALNYDKGAPPAIVAGFGGDNLDVTPVVLSGADLSGQYVKDGLSLPGFGFLMMEQEAGGWRIDVHDVAGAIENVCHFAAGHIDCGKA